MTLGRLLDVFFQALYLLIIVDVLASWLPAMRRTALAQTVRQVVEPMLAPFRRVLPPQSLGGLDLSPLFLILVLEIVQSLLRQLFPFLWRTGF